MSRKPRITFVISGLTPTLGLERVALNLISALDEGFDTKILLIGGQPADQALASNIEILGKPLTGWRRIRSFGRLYSHARKSDLGTVILVGVWAAVPWLVVAPLSSKTSSIVWEHTLLKEKLPHSRALRILKFLTRYLYKRADCIVGVSRPVADDIGEYRGIRRVEVIPNIVEAPVIGDIETLARASKRNSHRIVCIGSLTAIKAQHLAVEALSLLDEKYKLTIVGSGPKEKELIDLAEHLGVRNRVEFTGHLDRASVKDQLRNSSLLLHCSIAETFGLVYAEAADAAIPVVSVNTRVACQMIPDYAPGGLSEPSSAAIAETIMSMHSRPMYSPQDFIAAAERRTADFGVDGVRAAWVRVLSEMDTTTTQVGVNEENR